LRGAGLQELWRERGGDAQGPADDGRAASQAEE
jgi:hypothetical protein